MKKLFFLAPILLSGATLQQKLAPAASPAVAPRAAAKPAARPAGPQGTTAVDDVVAAANAFIATLSASQQTTLLQAFNATTVTKWSNFPIAGYNQRIGIRLDALTAAQQTAALAVVQAATGTTANEGFDEIQQIRVADDFLAANAGGSTIFGRGIYFLAFLGTPSTTGTWMLQFGGHHLATNITYGGGNVTGTTPKFEGVEPLSFQAVNANVLPTGVTYAPQAQEQAGMLALISSLTTAQKATAKLTQTFSDVVVGPQKDGQFPATRVGLPSSQLTSAQQQLVVQAMAPWVKDADDATAAALLSYYQSQLANTYIAYSGTGNFDTISDYVRLDGPNVWIELVVQRGAEFPTQIHYHTIYRDRARDYGGNFYGTYNTVTSTQEAAATQTFSLYPNPTSPEDVLQVKLASSAKVAKYTLRNVLGQTVATQAFKGDAVQVPIAGLKPGTYLLSLELDSKAPVTRRFVVQ